MRFLFKVAEAVRRAISDNFVVGAGISISDFVPRGVAPEDCETSAGCLPDISLDFIDVFSGGTTNAEHDECSNEQSNYTQCIRKATGLQIITVAHAKTSYDTNVLIVP
jgi:2,4-dienoyl-CoA reductase-like NADH-dependent reductase (Old Yellow Enzyme family)